MEDPCDVVLRGYTRDDLEAMFRLDEVCFAEQFRFARTDLRRFAEAQKAHVLLAKAGEELAGFLIVHMERSAGAATGYLLTLDVAPAFRRRGLAQRMLDKAESGVREAGGRAMLLHVFSGNAAAITLYEKLGYVRLGAAENFYGKGLHAWVYRKELARVAPYSSWMGL